MTMIPLGAFVAALGLQLFLLPNRMIDGGIVGVAMLVGLLTGGPVGWLTLAFNLPFLYLAFRLSGRAFGLCTLAANVLFAAAVALVQPLSPLTDDLLLASVFGGICLGVGVGIIVRYGGSLDGAEIVAVLVSQRTGFSVGELVLGLNALVLVAAGWAIGWERAMYSLLTTMAGYKAIDLAVQGLDARRSAWVISAHPDTVADAVVARFQRGVTRLQAEGGISPAPVGVLFCVINRLELGEFRRIVTGADQRAFVAVHPVDEVFGGRAGVTGSISPTPPSPASSKAPPAPRQRAPGSRRRRT